MKQLYFIIAFLMLNISCFTKLASAQSATVYRGGSVLGTYTTARDASIAANAAGDSIVLSAHTFKEHNIDFLGGQRWKGTITSTDSTIIDAESKGRIGKFNYRSKQSLVFRDVILTNGFDTSFSGAILDGNAAGDTLKFDGQSVVRNCFSNNQNGVSAILFAYGKTKIHSNSAGRYGGVGVRIQLYDSAEVCYNSAPLGGVAALDTLIYGPSGGGVLVYSPGVRIHHNKATKAGGVVVGGFQIYKGGQVYANEAPLAPFAIIRGIGIIEDGYIYNPGSGAIRQPEIVIDSNRELQLKGAWFGDSDTTGIIVKRHPSGKITTGKYAVANWSVNRGKAVAKKDSLFPVGALITYQDGSPVPAGSYTWLKGNFTTTKGTFLTPKPGITKDTVFSLYRTVPFTGDTSGKPVDFVCNIDLDTFKVQVIVWSKTGIDKLGTKDAQVIVYPNPATNIINIDGVESGSSITLQDLLGRQIKTVLSDAGGKTVIDVSALAPGNYMLKIVTKEGSEGSALIQKN